MIGSGIFLVAAPMMRELGSAGWLLAVWVLGRRHDGHGRGALRRSGGALPARRRPVRLSARGLRPLVGFLYGWTLFLVIQTGTIAAVAVAFARFTAVAGARGSTAASSCPGSRPSARSRSLVIAAPHRRQLPAASRSASASRTSSPSRRSRACSRSIALCLGFGFSRDVAAANFAAPWTAPRRRAAARRRDRQRHGGRALLLRRLEQRHLRRRGGPRARSGRSRARWSPVRRSSSLLYLAANLAYLVVLPADRRSPDGADPLARGIAYASRDRVGSAAHGSARRSAGVARDGRSPSWCRPSDA